ncbi:MAG: 4Fe-4S binding protein [Firmicutes bacterium]|nr:4Fe-4S binding protein [Bacillota bacterium]
MKKKIPGAIIKTAFPTIFQKPATVGYPFEPLKIDDDYRGELTYDAEACIGCSMCMRDCPANAIEIINIGTKEDKKFKAIFHLDHCIYCGQCVDSCPKDALVMSNNIELASLDRNNLKVERE